MDAERWSAVRALLEDAREVAPDRRAGWLSERAPDDPDLRAEVERMLALEDGDDGAFLRPPAPDRLAGPDGPVGRADDVRARLEHLEAVRAGAPRYEVHDEIGRGGVGLVLRATDVDLRRTLAMKVLRGDGAVGESAASIDRVARFVEEAQVTGQLEHPGVVPVHELGVDDRGQPYFTMRAVRGRTLREVFEAARAGRDGWTVPRAVDALLKVCDTIRYAHSRGIVHRDLKPSNVMVGEFGELYVMDWGLAKVRGREDAEPTARELSTDRANDALPTLEGAVLGTPCYMSPEQAAGRSEQVDERTDVYAAGAMLYELLAGAPPYAPEGDRVTPMQVLAALATGPPAPLARVEPRPSPELVAIAERAMARERDARYATMGAMVDDLRAFLEGRVVRAFETGAWAELKKWVGRNRVPAALAATALLAALLGLAATGRVAQAGRDAVLRMSDVRRLADLVAEADELWPARTQRVPAMRDWLARADALARRLDDHREQLRELAARRAGDALSAPFLSDEDAWRHEVVEQLVADLERFTDPEAGTVADVRSRIARANEVVAVTIDAHADAWDAALRSIADPQQCPLYAGLELEPQVGLIPLRRDPRSGLWEFAVWGTGEPPAVNEKDRYVMDAEAAVVLVLVPGGRIRLGADAGDRAGPHVDPDSTRYEQPSYELELDPYFLSKYELSWAQWQRLTGEDPESAFMPYEGAELVRICPAVERSWTAFRAGLRRADLDLPTEARWERAARAGTDEVYFCGDDPRVFAGIANHVDLNALHQFPELRSRYRTLGETLDGWVMAGPIAFMEFNPFGLYATLGNVQEWCLDTREWYEEVPPRAGDGLREDPSQDMRVVRGGSWNRDAWFARSAARFQYEADFRYSHVGARPCRSVDGLPGDRP